MKLRGAALSVTVALVAGCGSSPQESSTAKSPSPVATPAPQSTDPAAGEVVARYAGREVTRGQVLQEFERLPAPSRAYVNAPDRKRQFVENIILNDLLFAEGTQAGYERDPDIDRQVTDLRKRLVVQKVMRKYQTPPDVSDDQARAYYDQNKQLYSGTQVRASHVLVKEEDVAKGLHAELTAHPEKFAEVAKAKSTDTASASKGGDLGMFGQGRMVPEFEKIAFSLKVGEVSDVVKTQYGYHIITVTERKEGDQKPFDQVKEQIKATLRNKGMQDQVQGHFEALKRDAKVTIDDDALAKITPASVGPNPPLPPAGGH